jgi:DNA-binding transcriptional regulator GbsR (MarR family)
MTPLMERFVQHWGEMGSRWGLNRSVAQVHAFLFLLARPADAEEIAESLHIARSNVSSSLKELQSYGLVTRVHRVGDRRERFEALGSPWDMFLQIVEVRLHQFGEDVDRWYRDVRRVPVGTLKLLLRMGAKVARLVPGGR